MAIRDVALAVENYRVRQPRNVVRDFAASDRRGAVQEVIEAGTVLPVAYGYTGVQAVPVFRDSVANTLIASAGNTQTNRDRFGAWFAQTAAHNDEADQLLLQQYVLSAGTILDVLTVFLNDQSLNFDGWRSFAGDDDDNLYKHCAHQWGSAAVALASAYSANRDAKAKFTDLVPLTGLYNGAERFGPSFPYLFAVIAGANPVFVSSSLNITVSSTPTPYAVGALLDWLMSRVYGLGLVKADLSMAHWRTASVLGGHNFRTLTQRIRQASYDSDAGDTKNSNLAFAVPPDYRYAASGTLSTGHSVEQVLTKFEEVMPSLLLWERFDGKLAIDLWDSTRTNIVLQLGEDDLLTHPEVVQSNASAVDQVTVLFNGYENDFTEDSVTDGFVVGQQVYDIPGSYTFNIPAGVDAITARIVGGRNTSGNNGDSTVTLGSTVHKATGGAGRGDDLDLGSGGWVGGFAFGADIWFIDKGVQADQRYLRGYGLSGTAVVRNSAKDVYIGDLTSFRQWNGAIVIGDYVYLINNGSPRKLWCYRYSGGSLSRFTAGDTDLPGRVNGNIVSYYPGPVNGNTLWVDWSGAGSLFAYTFNNGRLTRDTTKGLSSGVGHFVFQSGTTWWGYTISGRSFRGGTYNAGTNTITRNTALDYRRSFGNNSRLYPGPAIGNLVWAQHDDEAYGLYIHNGRIDPDYIRAGTEVERELSINSQTTLAVVVGNLDGQVILQWASGALSGNIETRRIDLCFNRAQARRLSREHAENSKRLTYQFKATRKALGLEPGDLIAIDYQGLFDDTVMRVVDMSIETDLTVNLATEFRKTIIGAGVLPPPKPAADEQAPRFLRASIDAAGTTFTIAFDELLDPGNVPSRTAFTILETSSGGSASRKTGSTLTLNAGEVRIQFGSPVIFDSTLTVAYAKPSSNPLQDTAGNEVASFGAQQADNNVVVTDKSLGTREGLSLSDSVTTRSVDEVAPRFVSANIDVAGTLFTAVFDETLDSGSVPVRTVFNIIETRSNGSTTRKTGSSLSIVGREVRIPFGVAVAHDSTVTVAYTKPATNPLQDAAGNDVESFGAQSVTSNVATTEVQLSVNESLRLRERRRIEVSGTDHPVAVAEGLSILDSVTTGLHKAVSVAEGLSIVDSVVQAFNRPISVEEGITLAEALGTLVDRPLTVEEGLNLAEALTTFTSADRSLSINEALDIADAVRSFKAKDHKLNVGEGLGLGDAVAMIVDKPLSIEEGLGLADSRKMLVDRPMGVAEYMGIADIEAMSLDKRSTIGESLGLSDSVDLMTMNTNERATTLTLPANRFIAHDLFGYGWSNVSGVNIPAIFMAGNAARRFQALEAEDSNHARLALGGATFRFTEDMEANGTIRVTGRSTGTPAVDVDVTLNVADASYSRGIYTWNTSKLWDAISNIGTRELKGIVSLEYEAVPVSAVPLAVAEGLTLADTVGTSKATERRVAIAEGLGLTESLATVKATERRVAIAEGLGLADAVAATAQPAVTNSLDFNLSLAWFRTNSTLASWRPPVGARPQITGPLADGNTRYLEDMVLRRDRTGIVLNIAEDRTSAFTQTGDLRLSSAFEDTGEIILTVEVTGTKYDFVIPLQGRDTSEPYRIDFTGDEATRYTTFLNRIPTSGLFAGRLTLRDAETVADDKTVSLNEGLSIADVASTAKFVNRQVAIAESMGIGDAVSTVLTPVGVDRPVAIAEGLGLSDAVANVITDETPPPTYNKQTISLPSSAWRTVRSNGVPGRGWLVSPRIAVDSALLATTTTRAYFLNLYITSTGRISFGFTSVPSGGVNTQDLSDAFETSGGIDITVSGTTYSFDIASADRNGPYNWTPTNSDDMASLYAAISSATDATLVIRDGS